MMENEEAKKLLSKYQQGNCTEAEKALLERWYLQLSEQDHDIDIEPERIESLLEEVYAKLPGHNKSIFKGITLWYTIGAIAAIMLIALGLVTYNIQQNPAPASLYSNDIVPGTNKAILTLANGKKINLTDVPTGQLAQQPGLNIRKTVSGQVIYTVTDDGGSTGNAQLNNITTPNGGQWQVVLPDGTSVWLNAASSLTYPASFTGLKIRKVELGGEAYFEVAKDKAHPFIVQTDKQRVEVLGTHFNINSYKDEPAATTTLLEGRIKVAVMNTPKIKTLLPGQQATLSANDLSVHKADLEEAIAWKNGYFRFNGESITSIMRKLSRWYNIDVEYEGTLPTGALNGKVSRYRNISVVLQALELTQIVHFKISGRRVIVMK